MFWDFQTQLLQLKVIQTGETFFGPHMCDLIGVITNWTQYFLNQLLKNNYLRGKKCPSSSFIGIWTQFLTVFSISPNKWGEINTTNHQ